MWHRITLFLRRILGRKICGEKYQLNIVTDGGEKICNMELNKAELEVFVEKGTNAFLKEFIEEYISCFVTIDRVIFNDPATIVFFTDGEKVITKITEDDTFSPEIGVAMAVVKKLFGSRSAYKKFIKKYLPPEEEETNYTIFDFLGKCEDRKVG